MKVTVMIWRMIPDNAVVFKEYLTHLNQIAGQYKFFFSCI